MPLALTVNVLVLSMTFAVVLMLVSRSVPPLTVAVRGVAAATISGAEMTSMPLLVNGAAPTFKTVLPVVTLRVRVWLLMPSPLMVMSLVVP